MGKVRILEIKESVFADNGRQADQLRIRLKEKGVFLMNLMSSPGSGKTTTVAAKMPAQEAQSTKLLQSMKSNALLQNVI